MRFRNWIVWNPETAQGGDGSAPAGAAPVAAPAAPTAAPQPVGSPGPTVGGSGPSIASQGGTPAPAPEPTVRDILSNLGFNAASYENDAQALQNLVSLARQAQESAGLVDYGRQYMQHAADFQRYLAERQAQAQREAQRQRSWFEAPEFNAAWQHQVYRDPQTGELRAIPGAAPDTIQKYQQWVNHQTQFLNNLSRDPIGTIKPGIEQIVQETAGRMVQEALRRQHENQVAQSFVQQHSEWMHQRDQSGRYVLDPRTNMPALTPMGQQFARNIFEAERMGIQDSAGQQEYALTKLQNQYLIARMQAAQQGAGQPQAQAPGQQMKDNFLAQAAQQAAQPASASQGQAQGGYVPANATGPRALMDMMLKDFEQNGIARNANLVG